MEGFLTYLIGWRVGRRNIIFSDTRVTGRISHNYTSKIGILFPGCIYGISGSAYDAVTFLTTVQETVGNSNSVDQNWTYLKTIAGSYSFPIDPDRHFKILCSNRATGRPEFWIIDSRESVKQVDSQYDFVALGSSRDQLDDFAKRLIKSVTKGFSDKPSQLAERWAPYMVSFKFFQKFQSIERTTLERNGVGGSFHFVYQTADDECGQSPTLNVLTSEGGVDHKMNWWTSRVVYHESGFIVEKTVPPGQIATYSEGEFTRLILTAPLTKWTFSEGKNIGRCQQQLLEDMIEISINSPYYEYCIVGAIAPEFHNKIVTFPRESESTPYMIERSGNVSSGNANFINHQLFGTES
jgi:hypothetical protein